MKALVADMVQDDPIQRPTIDQVVDRFEAIRKELGDSKLRSRVHERDESAVDTLRLAPLHLYRRVKFTTQRVPAIPVR